MNNSRNQSRLTPRGKAIVRAFKVAAVAAVVVAGVYFGYSAAVDKTPSTPNDKNASTVVTAVAHEFKVLGAAVVGNVSDPSEMVDQTKQLNESLNYNHDFQADGENGVRLSTVEAVNEWKEQNKDALIRKIGEKKFDQLKAVTFESGGAGFELIRNDLPQSKKSNLAPAPK